MGSDDLIPLEVTWGNAEQTMIRDAAYKMNDFCVKYFSHSGAMICNLCLELAYFPLQPHQTRFIQHILGNNLDIDTPLVCIRFIVIFLRKRHNEVLTLTHGKPRNVPPLRLVSSLIRMEKRLVA